MSRVKEYTLVGIDASANGIAASQAPAASVLDIDSLALSQAFDIGAVVNSVALAQNPNNALSANAYATLQTRTAATPLTLQGAAASISPARRISITATTDESGTNFTIVGVGVDPTGAAITGEVIAGPNNTTVNSVNAYSSITSITPDVTDAVDQVSVGHPAYMGLGLTLEAGAAGLIPPRNISLVSGAVADFSNVNYTITGVGNDGAALVETIAGPNNSTVSTTGFFSSVTSIRPNRTAVSVSANISSGQIANSVPQPATLNGVDGNGIGVISDVFAAAKVTISSASDLSLRTFTVVGKDQYGNARSEVIAGPNNSTTYSAGPFTQVLSVTPDDDAANNFSVGYQSVAFAGLTLQAGAASLSPPRELVFDASADIATIVFTIVGTDRNGRPVTETITGVTDSVNPVTKNVYASVTSITPSAASSNTVLVGWPARTVSPWVICGRRFGLEQLPTAQVSILPTVGSADGIVEVTYDMNNSPAKASYPYIFEAAEQKYGNLPVDETIAVTPGTPVDAQGSMCRVALTSGNGTTGKARFAIPGP